MCHLSTHKGKKPQLPPPPLGHKQNIGDIALHTLFVASVENNENDNCIVVIYRLLIVVAFFAG